MSLSDKKHSILLIGDRPNWAYHEIIKFIISNLNSKYDFYYDFMIYNSPKIYFKSRFSNFILAKISKLRAALKTYISNLKKIRKIRKDQVYDLVVYLDYYMDVNCNFKFHSKKIVKGIYTEGFPPKGMSYDFKNSIDSYTLNIDEFKKLYLSDINALVCGAESVANFYKNYIDNVYVANSCLDENIFHPKNRIKKNSKTLIVGWSGNPNREFKGFYEVIVPAVERLKKEGLDIELKSRFKGPIETLHLFYSDIDLIAIASTADAGPSLFMEASLSGIPSISTKIGFPASIIDDGINGIFIERDIDSLVVALKKLYFNRELLELMSQKIRDDYIAKMGVLKQTERWDNLFMNILNY